MVSTKVYFIIPNIYYRQFEIIPFLRSIKNRNITEYLKHSLFPDQNKAIGGHKIIFQHCDILNRNGIESTVIKMGGFEGYKFGYDIKFLSKQDGINHIGTKDIVVSTEFSPYDGLHFNKAHKILFSQNWCNTKRRLLKQDQTKNYMDLGYDQVISCSDFITSHLAKEMGIQATTLTNGIDQNIFKPNKNIRTNNRVLCLSRKNPQDLETIQTLLKDSNIDFKIVDGLSQDQLVKEYQQADIFLATGYPEGFGLPPLEAMSCGCTVVGFTGQGALEYMHHKETAMVAEDGDCETAAQHLLTVINDNALKEHLREAGIKKSSEYSIENMERDVVAFYSDLIQAQNS